MSVLVVRNKNIPVKKILEESTRSFLKKNFPNIDESKDIEIQYNIGTSSSPGRVYGAGDEEDIRTYMFSPRNLDDLRELKFLGSNDTSLGCSFAPLSLTEKIVLNTEKYLNSDYYKKKNPWIGSDIKIMASRIREKLDITIAIPQLANFVSDIESYKTNIETLNNDVIEFVSKLNPDLKIKLHLNTKDNYRNGNLYLTAIGSAIESGDEGLVGRGNRINGLITPCRPMTIESACGKNPVYHVGKVYSIVANKIAERLAYMEEKISTEVYLISQNGRFLLNPWRVIIASDKNLNKKNIEDIVEEELKKIPDIKKSLLNGDIELF